MSRSLAIAIVPLLLCGSLTAIEEPKPAVGTQIQQLVAELGNADFATREAAEQELDRLGETALEDLRSACQSSNAETARRARVLVGRIERRLDNERTVAATVAELDIVDASLDEVLKELSKQSGYKLTSHRGGPEKSLTLKTGKVPFWEAVVRLCDAADLQIASVSGFVSPASSFVDTSPSRPTPLPSIGGRTTGRTRNAAETVSSPNIVLEPRGKGPKRPTAIFGAVMVEAMPLPTVTGEEPAEFALLQIWPEPKLNWQEVKSLHVERATDRAGQLHSQAPADPVASVATKVIQGNGFIAVQQANGGVILINQNGNVPVASQHGPRATPRQAIVKLKPGEVPADALKELTGVVHGTVRSKSEPLVMLSNMKPGEQAEGSHPSGVELRATVARKENGIWEATVELSYDQSTILPSNQAGEGRGASRLGGGSSLGIRVTDAAGKEYDLSTRSTRTTIRGGGFGRQNQVIRGFTFQMTVPGGKAGPPECVSFWGTFPKSVAVPFELTDVPLTRLK